MSELSDTIIGFWQPEEDDVNRKWNSLNAPFYDLKNKDRGGGIEIPLVMESSRKTLLDSSHTEIRQAGDQTKVSRGVGTHYLIYVWETNKTGHINHGLRA